MRAAFAWSGLALAMVVGVSAGTDAEARGRDARARFDAPDSDGAGDRRAPDGRVRLRSRPDGTLMDCRFRRLDARADYVLQCDVPGADAMDFRTDRRGSGRVRGLDISGADRDVPLHVAVRDADGGVVLETDVDHPSHDGRGDHGNGHHGDDGEDAGHHGDDGHHSDDGGDDGRGDDHHDAPPADDHGDGGHDAPPADGHHDGRDGAHR